MFTRENFRSVADFLLAVSFIGAFWAFSYWTHYDRLAEIGLYQYGIDKTLGVADARLRDAELITIKALKIDTSPSPSPSASPAPEGKKGLK